MSLHVCSGSIASVWRRPNHFRFPPDSDRIADIAPCPKGAKAEVRAPPLLVNVMDAASEKSPCHAFHRYRSICEDHCRGSASRSRHTLLTTGTFHVSFSIEGSSSFGQYIRSINWNLPDGAGNQLASFPAPGLSFWMYRSVEPSGFGMRF